MIAAWAITFLRLMMKGGDLLVLCHGSALPGSRLVPIPETIAFRALTERSRPLLYSRPHASALPGIAARRAKYTALEGSIKHRRRRCQGMSGKELTAQLSNHHQLPRQEACRISPAPRHSPTVMVEPRTSIVTRLGTRVERGRQDQVEGCHRRIPPRSPAPKLPRAPRSAKQSVKPGRRVRPPPRTSIPAPRARHPPAPRPGSRSCPPSAGRRLAPARPAPAKRPAVSLETVTPGVALQAAPY